MNSSLELSVVESQHQDAAGAERQLKVVSEIALIQEQLRSKELDCVSALNLLVERMLKLTRADGAAIALKNGNAVFCRASRGNAPEVGARLPEQSLSGECFRSGTLISCQDTDLDQRVDSAVCRELGFRSFLILPVSTLADLPIGIVEVLSSAPRKFDSSDVLTMGFLAELVATIEQAGFCPPDSSDLDAQVPSFPPHSWWLQTQPETESDFGQPTGPLVGNASLVADATLAVLEPHVEHDTAAPNRISGSNGKSSTAQVSSIANVPVRPRRARLAAYSEPQTSAKKRRMTLLAGSGGVALLASAFLLFGYYHQSNASSSAKNNSSSLELEHKSSDLASQPTSPAVVDRENDIQAQAPSEARNAARAASPASLSIRSSIPKVQTPEVVELQVNHGEASQSRSSQIESPEPAPTLAPSISNSPTFPSSAVPTDLAAPEFKTAHSQGISGGELLKTVLPKFPAMAGNAVLAGNVVLKATIATDGSVKNVNVVSGNPLLLTEAIVAAKQWRYSPYVLDGKPIEAETLITIKFNP